MRTFIRTSLVFTACLALAVSLQAQAKGATKKPATPAATPAPAAGGLQLPAYKKVKLKNGLTLLLMEQHEIPIVSFSFIVRAGSVADPQGKEGLASLTAGLLRKGTKARNADQISADLDFIGMSFGANVNHDYTSGSAEFLKKDMDRGLDLLSDLLLNPTFPEAEVAKMVKQRVDQVKASKDSAAGVIGNYYNAYLFGSHPYARASFGDEKSIAALNRADVAAFYAAKYVPANTIIAAVGDFAAADMEKTLTDRFGAWQGALGGALTAFITKIQPPLKLAAAPPVTGKKLLLVDKPDLTQTYFMIGNVGVARTNADRVGLDLVNTLFGGRFTSMLNSELRVNTGLTYGARSFFAERQAPGPFAISTYTRNATTEKAMDMALDILKKLHTEGVTEEQLKSAKAYRKGQFPPNIETTDQLAGLLTELEFYGLDQREINELYARIDALTVDGAKQLIQKYFPQENLVFTVVGKASEIEPVVKKYAPKMDKKSITEAGY